MICRNGQSIKINTDMNYVQDKFNLSSSYDFSTEILKPKIDEIKILKEYLTKVKYSHLGKNP